MNIETKVADNLSADEKATLKFLEESVKLKKKPLNKKQKQVMNKMIDRDSQSYRVNKLKNKSK